MAIKLQNKNIPQNPGIYLFSANGVILYVGKANNLRARIKSYFLKNTSTKTKSLINEATNLSWEVVGSEVGALVRESELIKKYHPKYNILMRDDKQYLYVGFTNEIYSKIYITHPAPEWRGSPNKIGRQPQYIGPFTDSGALKSTLKTLRRIFPYCTCLPRRNFMKAGKSLHKTPCLNAKIGRCLGFCCLKNEANKSSFERILRPFWHGLRKAEQNGRNLGASRWRSENERKEDLLGKYQKNIRAIKKILTGKNKSLLLSLKKEMKSLSKSQHYEEAGKIRNQIYALEKIFEHKDIIKKDMFSDRSRALQALEKILKITPPAPPLAKGRKAKIISPPLQGGAWGGIHRIEGYDISNIHGNFAYGSMVVFSAQGGDFGPSPKDYRIFKIRQPTLKRSDTQVGVRPPKTDSNDPAMIHEIISRRLKHKEWPYPDVMLIDGGPTQLSAARKALNLSLGGSTAKWIKIMSLAKRDEELYLSPHQKPIKIKESSESLYSLLTHIRDESHRFAIKHYRKLHRKQAIK